MLVSLLVIAVLDFITDYRIRLLPLYAVPIFVLSWFCGNRLGIAVAFFTGAIWWSVNWANGDPDLHSGIAAWEVPRHVCFFFLVALVGAALRAKSDIATERIALLERSQYLERDIVNISEAEQRRIGQDLHDGLCQYLAGLTCAASSLRDDLEQLNLHAEAKNAGELSRLLRDAVVQTRDLARRLVPAHVSRLGLVLALESLAQSVTTLHGINCKFVSHAKSANCDEYTALHLYRIAQEAISNATRHGKAKNIAVTLAVKDHSITLDVLDDGVGFSESDSDGMGLDIMRYRARLTGGHLTVDRGNVCGTKVSCVATINSRENESTAA
jgi:signal transduction histidine kinase